MLATPDGPRMLRGAERKLVRGVLGIMIDHLHDELTRGAEAIRYGLDHFDRWDPEQRVWLIEQMAVAALTPKEVPVRTAILEASLDAMTLELSELIQLEIQDLAKRPSGLSWRESLRAVLPFATIHDRPPMSEFTEETAWRRRVALWRDRLCGPHHYVEAESRRDGPPEELQHFLRQRALPPEYFSAVPPVVPIQRVQLAIDRVQRLVFQDDLG